ncbi:MAG: PHP domain-containing protein [Peptococcia bacterium]
MFCNKSYRKNNADDYRTDFPKADLHVHTTASDGAFSPRETVKLAYQKGISYLAITDHDTTAGLAEAAQECSKYELDFFPGIEFSTVYEECELHILGYNFDWTYKRVRETVIQLQNARVNRIEKMVAKLATLGIQIDFKEVRQKASVSNIGRVHLALVLMDKGIVGSIDEAFNKYLNRGCPAFVPRYKLTPCMALEIIQEAQGIPVLAHPGLSNCDYLIPLLVEKGLQGIEVFHPQHTKADELVYLQMAEKYHLMITGGSDFHGHEEKDLSNFGEMKVPFNSLKKLKNPQPNPTLII